MYSSSGGQNCIIQHLVSSHSVGGRPVHRLSQPITPGNHQWRGAAPLFNNKGVQMIIGVYKFLSNVNKSTVNVFVTTTNNSVAEASTCAMKYLNEASVLYMFLMLEIEWMNDIR